MNQLKGARGAEAPRIACRAASCIAQSLRFALEPVFKTRRRSLFALAAAVMFGLTACGSKEGRPGQSLARVGDDEITVHQVNDELSRLEDAKEGAQKQVLETLIDRQLLQQEATRHKLDRDPQVVQAIERSKAQVLAEAYLRSRIATVDKPARGEVQAYFNAHPELFAERRTFDLGELVISTRDLRPDLQAIMDASRSLDEVAVWLEAHRVQYIRRQSSRSTADLPPEMTKKMLAAQKGQLFIVKEGERTMLASLHDVKITPVGFEAAATQIEQYLLNEKRRESVQSEVSRLRAATKIEYLNQQAASAAPAAPAPIEKTKSSQDGDIAQGVAGLK